MIKHKIIKWVKAILEIPELQDRVDFLYKNLNVAVDLHVKGDSWAIVCLRGSPSYMNLMKLDSKDVVSIREFLKQFEKRGARNFFIDHPRGMEHFFK